MTEEEFRSGFVISGSSVGGASALPKQGLTKAEREEAEIGLRFDQGKPRYELLEPLALEELVQVYTMGAQKYADFNYLKGMDWLRIFGSLMRHAFKWLGGEDYDKESSLHHGAHIAWNALTLVSYSKLKIGKDNRWKSS